MSGVLCGLSWVTWKVNTSQSVDSPLRILINFVVTPIMIIISCILNMPSVSSGKIFSPCPASFKFPFRSKAMRRRTMAHTTNSSSSTATVSALPWHLLGAVQPGRLLWFPKYPEIPLHEAPSMQGRALEFTWAWETELPGMLRVSNTALNGFVLLLLGQDACRMLFILLSLAPGVRTEQDLYVRLIDSVTKQVRGSICATLSCPTSSFLFAQHFLACFSSSASLWSLA